MARPGLTGHRKFRRLTRMLEAAIGGTSPIGAAGIARAVLELLWEPCYESGNDFVGTAEDIEYSVGWKGDPGALTRALAEAGAPEGYGFIDPLDQAVSGSSREPLPLPLAFPLPASTVYRIHDLWHHAPEYVKKRREREIEREQKMAPNQDRRRTADTVRREEPTSDLLSGLGGTPSPAPSPAPSPSPAPAPAPAPKSVSPPVHGTAGPAGLVVVNSVLVFPTTGRGDKVWHLTPEQLARWQEDYPALDILSECRRALAWLEADPREFKTAKGMPRFLVSWFNRSTDRRGPRAVVPQQPPAQTLNPRTAITLGAAARIMREGQS